MIPLSTSLPHLEEIISCLSSSVLTALQQALNLQASKSVLSHLQICIIFRLLYFALLKKKKNIYKHLPIFHVKAPEKNHD